MGRNFTSLTIRDGLTQGIAVSAYADDEDNIWIGTENGVSRVEGREVVATLSIRTGCSQGHISHSCGWMTNHGSVVMQGFQSTISTPVPFATSPLKWIAEAPTRRGAYMRAMIRFGSAPKAKGLYNSKMERLLPTTTWMALFMTKYVLSTRHARASFGLGLSEARVVSRTVNSPTSMRMMASLTLLVHYFYQDLEGMLWIGTDDGLFRYQGQRFDRLNVGRDFTTMSTRS